MSATWISGSVLDGIAAEAGLQDRLETGGMLLGYRRGGAVVVTTFIGPGPEARRGTSWFVPDAVWQEQEVARLYAASGRTVTYLGDWHTHPGGAAVPSRRDRRTLARIACTASARQPHPLMAILGPIPTSDLAVWAHVGRFHAPVRCSWRRFEATAANVR